jgi:virginiamycin B lyase
MEAGMPNPVPNPTKYFAFLTYSDKDAKVAATLGRYLETFRVPVRLGGKEQQLPRRMAPIFRDRAGGGDSSDLSTETQEALAESGALIVLCSPSAARSKWVNEEIRVFRRVGNRKRVFSVLLAGDPGEAFPPALLEDGEEPLAVDFRPHHDSLHDAHVRLAAALLNVDFDALKRRAAARVRVARLRLATVIAVLALAVAGYELDQPRVTANPLLRPAYVFSIAATRDGAAWFTEGLLAQGGLVGNGRIGEVSPDGRMTYFPVPMKPSTSNQVFGVPFGIAAGPDGAFWFTVANGSYIGRITSSGKVTQYPIRPPAGGFQPAFRAASQTAGIYGLLCPSGITLGPDGAMWFTDPIGARIGRITLSGKVTEFEIPSAGSFPMLITSGPDGALWFTEVGSLFEEGGRDQIGRITTNGQITEYPLPKPAIPIAIAAGSDGALWFTEQNKIGRITTSGSITEYRVPTMEPGFWDIAAGPDGALWFTNIGGQLIGRITTRGRIDEYRLPSGMNGGEAGAGITITAGRGRFLWFGGNMIGKITAAHWFFGR